MFKLFKKKKSNKSEVVEAKTEVAKEPVAKELVVEEPVEKEVEKKRRASNHITKHPQGGWQIKKSGSDRALKRFKTQKDAIEFAKGLEDTTRTGYIIHKADGKTRKKTY